MNLAPVGLLPQGTVLYQGRFRIDLLLAHAPQRAVYRAWDLTRDRPATILELATSNAQLAGAALDHAAPLVQLEHPELTPFQVVFVEQNTVFIGLALAGGQTIDRIMAERSAPITPVAAVRWITQAAEALDFLARELPNWHLGDVSAAAMLVTAEDRVQLLSFELPLGMITPQDIAANLPVGMVAPELQAGCCDARSDVFGLAATLHLLLTRRVWLNGTSASEEALVEQRPDLARQLIATLARGLADDPAARWPDPATFAQALLAAMPGDRPAGDWWLVGDSPLNDLEEPPTLVTPRDQLRAAVAAEAAAHAASLAASHAAQTPDLPELQPLEASEPLTPDEPATTSTPAYATAPAALEDVQRLVTTDQAFPGDTAHVLDIFPLLANEADPGAVSPAIADPLAPANPTTPSRNDYAAAPLGALVLAALPFAALAHTAPAPDATASELLPDPAPPSDALVSSRAADPPRASSLEATPIDEAGDEPEPANANAEQYSAWLLPAMAEDFPAAPRPMADWQADPAPAMPLAVASEQMIVAHPDLPPATDLPLAPASKTPTRPLTGILGRLRTALHSSAPTLARATGTVVVPRHMYPNHSYAILLRLQCPPGLPLGGALSGATPSTIVELEATSSAFYAPVRRLALRVPVDGGLSEGSLHVTALRTSPVGTTDRLVFVFRAPDGTILHQGHFIAEVAILAPQQGVTGDPMIALVHALDLS